MEDKKEDIVEQVRRETREELESKAEDGKKETEEDVEGYVEKQIPQPQPQVQQPQRPEFFNATNLKFIDIGHEEFRQYLFPNGAKIEIQYPLKLNVDNRGIHRVYDATGLSYYIPPSWISVVTKPRPGGPDIIM